MVAVRGRALRFEAVGKGATEILLLQHLAKARHAPVGDEELQPRVIAGATEAVVPEHSGDSGPHLGHLVGFDEDAEPLGEHRVGGQPASDPEVESGRAVRSDDAHERDVVDLVVGAVPSAAGDRRLELAWQVGVGRIAEVGVHDREQRGAGVQHRVFGDAFQRTAEHDPWGVATRFGG